MSAENERKDEPESRVALSESEVRFRLLIDSLQDYSVFALSVDGRVSNWNLGAQRLKGYSTEEAIGLHISIFFPEQENAERVPERILRRAEADGRAEYEGWLVRKDRSQFWGTVILNPMRDQEGRLRGFSNVARDLTERKKIEKAQAFLAEAGEVLTGSLEYERTLQEVARLAVHSMADWCTVAIRGSQGLAVVSAAHANRARETWTRELLRVLPLEETKLARGIGYVVRTGMSDLCPDTMEASWVRAALGVDTPERLMELGARSYMCVPLKARGDTFGAITFVSATPGRTYGSAELTLAEELVRRAGLAVDNARLFRKAQEALKARDEFLSMASHDLRSPLTSLRLQLQAVRKDMQKGDGGTRSPEKLSSRVEAMVRQTDRMLHMMDALLDISQMTAGRLELKRQKLDLVELVRDSVSTLDEELRQAGVELRLHAEGPVEGAWDRLRLEQVVDNLLSNAVKYGKGQPVDLTVSTEGKVATLVVRDRGVGIAPEDQGRLFDRFERVRLDREVTGYGVGLWIVRRVVEAHGGSVNVESRLGEGSTFIVQLPLTELARTQPGRPQETEPEARPPAFH
ncbi:PAS domain S-box protein [Pyxidicoccus fallax]|uniref:histidine kinase n=1 Tax=Pyxidicoccus fallax TaxID=394095 RepID=A0A848LER6_9BACT|nr:ATP-binding protein [Pyxidicoccus fallax]NMO16976.1 PAS domain S-box protein [Pyxidicoccus fallax]NPC79009.1 PAS domain S-box protein [Pyxidicoccus fallax]